MSTTSVGYSVIKRIACEFFFIVVSIFVMWIGSAYLEPLFICPTLSPDGLGQGGWPLPFASSYWEDMGMKSHQVGHFDFGAFVVNVLIFYILVRLVVATLESIIHRYDRQQYKELVLRTAKRIVVMTIFLCLVYGAYALRVAIITAPQEVFPLNP